MRYLTINRKQIDADLHTAKLAKNRFVRKAGKKIDSATDKIGDKVGDGIVASRGILSRFLATAAKKARKLSVAIDPA